MDNVTPLQQLSAIAQGTTKPATASGPSAWSDNDAWSDTTRSDGTSVASLGQAAGAMPSMLMFAPRETVRVRNSTAPASGTEAEYPAAMAQIDLYFQNPPPADAKVEIADARGQVIKSWGVIQPRAAGGGGQEMRGFFRRGGVSSPGILPEAGMQRLSWDMRYPGPWSPNAPEGGPGGPMVPPGKYTIKFTAGGQTTTRTLDVKSDPRLAADGVTDGDLAEQVKFQLSVRDAVSDARKLQASIEEAMKAQGVKPVAAARPGESPTTAKYDHPLQKLWAQVADTPGIYVQGMLVSQLGNIQRMVGQADQKVGKDAYDRFGDLQTELARLQAEFAKIGR
jgi:hypothetical protein